MPGVPKVRGLSPELDKLQERTDRGIQANVPQWLLDGHLIEQDRGGLTTTDLELPAGVTKLKHGLGRAPAGWVVLRAQYPGAPGPVLTEQFSDKNSLNLVHTGPDVLKVKIWVF